MTTELSPAALLDAEKRRQFERDGYFVFDLGLPAETIDAVPTDVEPESLPTRVPEIDDLDVKVATGTNPRVKDAWKISDNVRALALAPNALGTIEALYERKPLAFQTLNFPKGSEQLPHADAMHFYSDPPDLMCGVWVALEDIDMDNGPLVYFPGSHKLPLPTWEDLGDPDREEYPSHTEFMNARHHLYELYCRRLVEEQGLKPAYGTIKKGQALLWSARLLHGGSPQNDKSRSRHSQVTHYYFEGCRHYTPMRSEGDHIFWNYPEWIRWKVPGKDVEYLPLIRESVEATVPVGASMLVVSNGMPELLELGDRRTAHFPQAEDGTHLGKRPDYEGAIEHLEDLRAKGAEYLLFPRNELWWLTSRYPQLQEHLEARYRTVERDGGSCAIYALK